MEEREEKLIKKISIWILLAILLIGFGTICIFLFIVIPSLATMFEDMGSPLPLPTRVIVGISSGLRHYWYFSLLPTIGVLILVIWAIKKALFRSPVWLPILLIPVSLVLLGALVGFIVISVLLPIHQISEIVK